MGLFSKPGIFRDASPEAVERFEQAQDELDAYDGDDRGEFHRRNDAVIDAGRDVSAARRHRWW